MAMIKRQRVQRLMPSMGLAGMAPGPNMSKGHPEQKVYPNLLRGVPVARPNQVWGTDVTHTRTHTGLRLVPGVQNSCRYRTRTQWKAASFPRPSQLCD
jgi:putative transposase